jgi:hypothetical protein
LFFFSITISLAFIFIKQINKKGGSLSLVINFEKITILAQIINLANIIKIYPLLEEATIDIQKEI